MVRLSRMNRRQNRRNSRRNTRRQRSQRSQRSQRQNAMRQNAMRQNMMGGGALQLTPMELKDTSMLGPSKQSIEQGIDFFGYHSKQHGGAAPVGTTGVLDEGLRGYARLAPLDKAYTEIAGLRDQAGGRRRRASRKQRKASRKQRKGSRKQRNGSRKQRKGTRKMQGGARELGSMPVDAPGTLLPPALARAALSTMNQEWKLAENPRAFAPGGL